MALSLRLGDRLIGVAPGTWVDPDTLQGERGWQRLYQDWGFDLVIPEQSLGQWTYFSATDNDRAALLRQPGVTLAPTVSCALLEAGALRAALKRASIQVPHPVGVLAFPITVPCSWHNWRPEAGAEFTAGKTSECVSC